MVKSVSIPVTRIEHVIDDGVYIDGSSILGYATIEESDMRANPILDSFQIYPWIEEANMQTARFMCTISDHSGNRFKGDPRWVLEKMVAKVKDMGYSFNVGPEFEFFLFPMDDEGKPVRKPADSGGYFDLMPMDAGEMARKHIMLMFDELHYDMEASHHEVAPGQVEVDMRYQDALTMADRVLTLKYGIKTMAMQYGFYATFMPKPIFGLAGSGMHVHQSMASKDKNAFDDPNGAFGLSDMAMKYIGGLLAHARDNCAILASYVNSYKRLVPGYEAPCYLSWANMNRRKSQGGSNAETERRRQSRSPARTGTVERRKWRGGPDRKVERQCKFGPGVTGRGERKAHPQGKANRASIRRKRNRKEPALKGSAKITVTWCLPDATAKGGQGNNLEIRKN
jgi:glutamine synthetase